MNPRFSPALPTVLALAVIGLALAACATTPQQKPPATPAVTPTLPPAFPARDLVGRWGLGAYHQAMDRDRTIAAAAEQCRNPYIITPSSTGGVMMHLADQPKRSDLHLKGGPNGKTYLGLPNKPPGDDNDRIVESFNGRVLILRWVDADTQTRYGTMVYVRCAPEGQKPAHKRRGKLKPRVKSKSTAKPKAKSRR